MAASAGYVALGALLGGATAAMTSKSPSIPKPPEPEKQPESQAAKMPDTQSVLDTQKGMGQAGGSPGVAQTFLTGTGGVDQSSLDIKKPLLLG